jgi:nucleotide-binding universal stress UspA family protein/predicted transcriptional regulator
MTNWTCLLVPLDGSAVSDAVIPYAERLAHLTGAHVHVLSVIEAPAQRFPGLPAAVRTSLEQLERTRLEQHQRDTAAALRAHGLSVVETLTHGDPATVILAAAVREQADLIILGTRGRGGMERWLVGSVADTVMRRSTTPTLLIRPPETTSPPTQPAAPLQRLVVPLDGSSLAEAALPLAGELAARAGAAVTLVQVVPWLTGGTTPVAGFPELAQAEQAAAREAEAYLAEVSGRLPSGLRADTLVLRGPPASSLIHFLLQHQADLVVMTTHGRGGLRRLVLGSVADRLVRAGVPTLLIRPAAAAGSDTERVGHPRPLTRGSEITAGDIMTQPALTVGEDATLEEVARLMLDHSIGCVPVVDTHGLLQGIITESDFTGQERYFPFSAYRAPQLFGEWISKEEIEAIYAAGRRMRAREIMHTPVVTAAEGEPVADVVEKMLRHDITRVPVVRDGVPIGIVARHDLLRLMVSDATEQST